MPIPTQNSSAGDRNMARTATAPGATSQPVVCGDLDMRIARDGTWFYHGSPIGRKRLVALFASVLRREADGEYYLVTPAEKGRVSVEDAPFVAVELAVEGGGEDQVLVFRTNLDDHVSAGSGHPIRVAHNQLTGEPAPYVHIRGGLEALIGRAVFYELVDLGVEAHVGDAIRFGVWSGGVFFPLDEIGA